MTMAAYLGRTPPAHVYRPSREWTDDELRRLRAATNAANAHWTLDPSATDPTDEPLPDVAEDGSDVAPPPEPEPERKPRPRRERVTVRPVTRPTTGETWQERFWRTGDPMAPAQTGRERADG